ncbi:MAG: TonB-dependent receptor [Acidobacteriota bacterium]|nr:TonB-dependent receptor [Acidobacteriota bacterium]
MSHGLKCLFLFVLLSPFTFSQTTGSIQGKVVDNEGSPLPGVTVLLESEKLIGTRTDVSRADGSFLFRRIPPGEYTITSTLTGMATDKTTLTVALGGVARPTIVMKPEATEETLTVVGSSDPVLDNVEVAAQFKSDIIDKLPTLGRSQADIARLSPGVTFNGGTGAAEISGANSGANTWLINGADSRFDNIRSQPGNAIIEDSIQETTVMTAAVSAEYGQFGGGVVAAVTKSGGNTFAGSLRFALSNPDWTAETPLERDDPNFPGKSDEIDHVDTVTFGGPIIKDRLWFFVAAQQSEENIDINYVNPNPITDTAAASYGVEPQVRPGVRPVPGRVDEDERFEVKLTGQLTDGHNLSVSYLSRETLNVNNTSASFDETTLATRTVTREQSAITYNGVINPNLSVEVQYTERESVFEARPIPPHLQAQIDAGANIDIIGTSLRYRRSPQFRINSPQFLGKPDEPRGNETLRAQLSYFLVTESMGTHDFSIGLQTLEDYRFADNRQYVNDWEFWSDFRFEGNTAIPIYSNTSSGGRYRSRLYYRPIEISSMTTRYETDSAWVNDTFTLNDEWRFNIGFRFDQNDGVRADGLTSADDSIVSPRLSVNYDLRGEGKHEFNASYSVYAGRVGDAADDGSQAGSTSTARLNYGGPQTENYLDVIAWINETYGEDFFLDPLGHPNSAAWEDDLGFSTINRGDLSSPNQVFGDVNPNGGYTPNGLDSPHTVESRIGYQIQFGSKGFFKADFVHRDFEDFYVSHINQVIGSTNNGRNDLTVINNDDSVYNKEYNGVQTSFRWRFNDKLRFSGNYTWSQLIGNTNGGSTSGILSPSSALTEYPEYNNFANRLPRGYLRGDQRHVANLFLTYEWDTQVGFFDLTWYQRFATGSPYDLVLDIDIEDDPTAWGLPAYDTVNYLDPPDDITYYVHRGGERAQDVHETNLAINYAITYKRFEFFVEFDIINLFNADNYDRGWSLDLETDVNQDMPFNVYTETPVEGVHYTVVDRFGEPDSNPDFQTPRTYRIDIGFRF